MLRDRVQAFVTDLLPAGDFWTSDASETFVRALGGVFEGIAEVADGLRDAIFPGKAERDVLLQWWDFIRSKCVGTPTDTEELRTAVLAAISSPPGHTIAGLRQIVAGQGLEFVELRHKLPVSSIPADVPFDVEPTGRIVEVWNAPILHNPELVRCVVREFAQAADLVRIVEPSTSLRQVGSTASEVALAWEHERDATTLHVTRTPGGVGTPVTEVLSLAPLEAVAAFDDLVGLTPDCIWSGQLSDPTGCSSLTAEGGAVLNVGNEPLVLRRARYSFDGVEGSAFAAADSAVGDAPDSTSFAVFFVARYNSFPSEDAVAGGKINASNIGWTLFLRPSAGQPVWMFRVRNTSSTGFDVPLTATSNTQGEWRAFVAIIDRTAQQVRFASDLESGTPVAVSGSISNTEVLRIGDSRINSIPIDGDVAMLAFASGTAIESLDPQTAAQALVSDFPDLAGAVSLDRIFDLDPALDVTDDVIEWRLERDFGSGPVAITPTHTATI